MVNESFIASFGLLAMASCTVYAGAWGSLPPRPKSTSEEKGQGLEDEDEEDEDEHRMTAYDAYMFPILLSCILFGMHLTLKYLGVRWVNRVSRWFYSIMGVGHVWKSFTALLRLILGRKRWMSFDKNKLCILKGKRERRPEVFSKSFRTPTAFLFPLAVIPSIANLAFRRKHRPILVTNLLALSSAYDSLCRIKIDSFSTAGILLCGLLVYDVVWVFGSKVMIQVALRLDGPIKIVWPRAGNFFASRAVGFLGLGDIVIPGALVALALRRDLSASPARDPNVPFAKPYFTAALTAYVVGLVGTTAMLHLSKRGQPALLYLSPACILSFLFTAIVRGELGEILKWQDSSRKTPESGGNEEPKVGEPNVSQNCAPVCAPDCSADAAAGGRLGGKPKESVEIGK